MKFFYVLLCHSSMISACCWKNKPPHFPKAPDQMRITQIQPRPVIITNINELVTALSALQHANAAAASRSITPTPGEPHTVTPELNKHEKIDVSTDDQMVTLSRLKRSHALIESFYTYPPSPSDEKINK